MFSVKKDVMCFVFVIGLVFLISISLASAEVKSVNECPIVGNSCTKIIPDSVKSNILNGKCQNEVGSNGGTAIKCAVCGDGVVEGDEQCDLGADNGKNKFGCDDKCQIEFGNVNLSMDKNYISQTIKDRLFDPSQYKNTIFDKYDCSIEVPIAVFDTAFDSIKNNLNANLAGIDDSSKTPLPSPLIEKKVMEDTKITTFHDGITYRVFSVSFGELPNGLSKDKEVMKQLVAEKKIRCDVSLRSNFIKSTNILNLDNCVKFFGSKDAKFGIVTMVGISAKKDPSYVFQLTISNAAFGYGSTDPFEKYQNDFSFYADLKEYDDSNLFTFGDYEGQIALSTGLEITSASSCGKDKRIYNFYSLKYRRASTLNQQGVNFLSLLDTDPSVVMHETGHSFCKLFDEYTYTPLINPVTGLTMLLSEGGRNCRPGWYDFTPYGENGLEGCTNNDWFRSTKDSIMNQRELTGFNVISCAYCLRSIKDISFDNAEKECAGMNTVRPGKQCFSKLEAGYKPECKSSAKFDQDCVGGCVNNMCVPASQGSPCLDFKDYPYGGRCNSAGQCSTQDKGVECINSPTHSAKSDCTSATFADSSCIDGCSPQNKCIFSPEGKQCETNYSDGIKKGTCDAKGRCVTK